MQRFNVLPDNLLLMDKEEPKDTILSFAETLNFL
jgi:hypothetical protein